MQMHGNATRDIKAGENITRFLLGVSKMETAWVDVQEKRHVDMAGAIELCPPHLNGKTNAIHYSSALSWQKRDTDTTVARKKNTQFSNLKNK